MATKFEKVSGSYNQKSKDGDTQSSNKYGNTNHPESIKDSGKHTYNQKSGGVKDSGE